MSETLEAKSVRVPQTADKGRVPETLSDLRVEIDVTERLPYLQPRPSQWFRQVLPQLNRLLELAPNWDSYNADPVSRVVVDSAADLLQSLAKHFDLPAPVVSATRSGGVLFEWETATADFEIELVSPGAASYVFSDEAMGEEYEGALFPDSFDDGRILHLLERLI